MVSNVRERERERGIDEVKLFVHKNREHSISDNSDFVHCSHLLSGVAIIVRS